MGDRLETPGAADKNPSLALFWKHVSQVDGRQTVSSCTGSGTACFRPLQSNQEY